MRSLVLGGVAAGLCGLLAAPAHSAPAPHGLPCDFTWDLDGSRSSGSLRMGPVVLADRADVRGNPVAGTMTCRLSFLPAPISASGTAVIAGGSTVTFFTATGVGTLCTELDLGSVTWYWDYRFGWVTDPAAQCPLV